ncbi:hypothetical protein AVEN_255745-1 [Araneus ventricosus]|uniref:Uncharacterized protein n=1 Tax=Araneus ventricosus TaxID=182803 RepID=A0A4Y2HAB4_ARAVE|nr:hypothetical protein AVEN_255745-1 [Araneus ventricosus]
MELIILNHRSDDKGGTRDGTPSPKFLTTPEEGNLTHYVRFNEQQAYIYGRSLMESGAELSTLWFRSRDFTTRPSRPQLVLLINNGQQEKTIHTKDDYQFLTDSRNINRFLKTT